MTAEYGMLPGSTHTRNDREATRGKQGGRTLEIQRLIGRALRASVDMEALGERTIRLDCDVIQADGGTRTASITGSSLALYDAVVSLGVQGVLALQRKDDIDDGAGNFTTPTFVAMLGNRLRRFKPDPIGDFAGAE